MSKDNGGAAFPVLDYLTPDRVATCTSGMTLRDYFAAKALQSVILNVSFDSWPACAKAAYDVADAMLAERVKL